MARPMVRRVAWAAGGVAVVAALAIALRPAPVLVDVAVAVRGPLRVTVDEDGRTRIKERYVIAAPVFGRVQRTSLKAGDKVEAGKTVVAVIDPVDPSLLDARERATAQARLRAAEEAVKASQARQEKARAILALETNNLTRARQIGPTRGMSQEEVDRVEHAERIAREEVRAAQFAVRIAEYEAEQARIVLARYGPVVSAEAETHRFDVRSPIDGKVLKVHQESEAVIPAGTRLVEVGNPLDLEVEIDVLSRDAVRIAPGAKAELDHWGGDALLRARVRLVEPAGFLKVSALGIEEQRVYVIADLVDPPAARPRLGDGYRVEARIVVWEAADVLKVPAGAVFPHSDGHAVYAVIRGRAVLTPVRVGHSDGRETEVLDGLTADDVVIVHAGDRVVPGAAVKPR
jgi:HlyD family secretion protein